MFFIIFSYALVWIFIASDASLPTWLVYKTHVMFFLSMITFLFCWMKDPGYLKKDPDIDFSKLIERFDPNHLCPECEVIRTERSRHCNICNRCVERFDHHCPWINNCVGARNHGIFYFYIIFTITYLVGRFLFYLFFVVVFLMNIIVFYYNWKEETFSAGEGYHWIFQKFGFEIIFAASIFICVVGLFFLFPLV